MAEDFALGVRVSCGGSKHWSLGRFGFDGDACHGARVIGIMICDGGKSCWDFLVGVWGSACLFKDAFAGELVAVDVVGGVFFAFVHGSFLDGVWDEDIFETRPSFLCMFLEGCDLCRQFGILGGPVGVGMLGGLLPEVRHLADADGGVVMADGGTVGDGVFVVAELKVFLLDGFGVNKGKCWHAVGHHVVAHCEGDEFADIVGGLICSIACWENLGSNEEGRCIRVFPIRWIWVRVGCEGNGGEDSCGSDVIAVVDCGEASVRGYNGWGS